MCFAAALAVASTLFLLQDVLAKYDNSCPIKINTTPCLVYTAVQHYSWLVVFCCMLVEGVGMYLSLVKVFGSHTSRFMTKAIIFSLGRTPCLVWLIFIRSEILIRAKVDRNIVILIQPCNELLTLHFNAEFSTHISYIE